MARLKIDENLPDDAADLLIRHGHDAVTVAEQRWRGMADADLWQGVQDEGRWLVTADKEFGDLRRYPPGSHAGIILLRLARQNRRDYSRLVETTLAQVELDELVGAVIVANELGVRVRRP